MDKREKEEYYFNKFKEFYALPSGKIDHKSRERPDVMILGEKKIGIEITNFFIDQSGGKKSQQNQIAMRKKIISTAQKEFQNKYNNKIEYQFGFNKEIPIRNFKKSVADLQILAERFLDHPVGTVSRDQFEDIPEVSFVWRGNEYNDCTWFDLNVSSPTAMNVETLSSLIRDKEILARGYEESDELWLLIVIDFFDPSQDQEIQNVPTDTIKSNIFDKIIIFKTVTEQIIEINKEKNT